MYQFYRKNILKKDMNINVALHESWISWFATVYFENMIYYSLDMIRKAKNFFQQYITMYKSKKTFFARYFSIAIIGFYVII